MRPNRLAVSLVLTVAVAAPAAPRAQDPSSELALFELDAALAKETTVASRRARSIRETPGVVTVLEREDLLFGPRRVKRGETPCLGTCTGGPIVVVYPEGIWYGGVTPELLERIVVEHLKEGRVVEEAVFFRLTRD